MYAQFEGDVDPDSKLFMVVYFDECKIPIIENPHKFWPLRFADRKVFFNETKVTFYIAVVLLLLPILSMRQMKICTLVRNQILVL